MKDSTIYQATVNEFGDKILANLDKMLVKEEVDPLKLDDVYKVKYCFSIFDKFFEAMLKNTVAEFLFINFDFLIITYIVKLKLFEVFQ